ncbi:MAG TPA: hypothetical protein VM492_15935 [Sumerlaeia bacterium]|nr:hypothetical protein [Sumerlaeia bacterium]
MVRISRRRQAGFARIELPIIATVAAVDDGCEISCYGLDKIGDAMDNNNFPGHRYPWGETTYPFASASISK